MLTLRDLKDKFLLCENEYIKFKQECDDTQHNMQDDLKSMFEKSETILMKYEKTKNKLDEFKKVKGEANPARYVELNNKIKAMNDTLQYVKKNLLSKGDIKKFSQILKSNGILLR